MVEFNPVIHTPLQAATWSGNGLVMGENLFCSKVIIRADFGEAKNVRALAECLHLDADLTANHYCEDEDKTLFWLGPDERLLHSVGEQAASLVERLHQSFGSVHHSVVDVSDYYTVIRVAGDNARAVLATGTPLDLHERVFADGQCAQTRFGNASVLIANRDPSPVFDVQVRWSFAEYVWAYLRRVADYRQ